MTFTRKTTLLSALLLTVSLFLTACGGGGNGQEATQQTEDVSTPTETGSVEYMANFDGEQPERARHDASGNPECGVDTVMGQEIVVNDNQSLRDAILAVQNGPSGLDAPAEDVVIDQKNCRYQPHVNTVKAGQTVTITDKDPNMHNVRASRPESGEQLFNETTFEGDELEKTFDEPGLVKLECDIHPWMESWVYVTEHGRAAVTGEDGKATLEDLPTGDYDLEVWHEEFDAKSHSATVEQDQTVSLEDTFQAES